MSLISSFLASLLCYLSLRYLVCFSFLADFLDLPAAPSRSTMRHHLFADSLLYSLSALSFLPVYRVGLLTELLAVLP